MRNVFYILWSIYLLCFRFEKFWLAELEKHGKEKASVARACMAMIKKRLILAIVLTFIFAGFAILGPVSTSTS